MPVTEHRPSFLHEAWALYGIGTLVLLLRFAVRLKTVGIRGMQGDDLFSVLVLIFFAGDAFTVHLIYSLGTNVEASVIQQTTMLSPSDIADFTQGSKLQLVAWYTYTALLWSLKGTMLCFLSRMTIGTWHSVFVKIVSGACALSYVVVFLTLTFGCFPTHKNWQVVPDPGKVCTFKLQNFLVTTVLNVLTDAAILGIPVPLLWKLQVPLKKKLVVGVLLSSGVFVIGAAITRLVLTLSANPSALSINGWGVRETIVGIIAVNVPILRPMFTRNFWQPGMGSQGSTLRSGTGGGGKSTNLASGVFELTSNAGKESSRPRRKSQSSNDGSQELIVKQELPSVYISTTYEVRSDMDNDDDSLNGQRGGHKVSIHGGNIV